MSRSTNLSNNFYQSLRVRANECRLFIYINIIYLISVSDVEPSLEGVDDLVEELNKTNNLRCFMLEMRNKFKATVKDS